MALLSFWIRLPMDRIFRLRLKNLLFYPMPKYRSEARFSHGLRCRYVYGWGRGLGFSRPALEGLLLNVMLGGSLNLRKSSFF